MATATLPPRPLGFTGRSTELGRLLPHLEPDPTGAAARPLLIFAVTGMGGIGKTALAIEAAHQACAEGWFPGGTLFVDLRGYDDNPVTADQAVLALLDALGVRSADLPPTAARQYDVYRTLLAERQQRMLLILDNASDPAQYLPLLPGTDRHRVLITSRDRPDSLGVRLIDLETLPEDDSIALITRALHNADERDERPSHEPDALRELTSLCGHLPLALQIAAAMLRRRRRRGIASLIAEIKKTGDPTTVLDKGSRSPDIYGRFLALRPVLDTSYRRLPLEQARLLRLLSLAPGAETGTDAVAALADLDIETALSLLEDLAATYLITPVESASDGQGGNLRWRLHDLVRAYGVGVVAGEAELAKEGEAARERVLGFYCAWTFAADAWLRWFPGMPVPEWFSSRQQALGWLDEERAGLVAAVGWGERKRYADTAVGLAEYLSEYLYWRRYFDDWITVGQAALEAARNSGNLDAEAIAWSNLGIALREAGRAEEAIEAHAQARDLFQELGDRHLEASAWNSLGIAMRVTGQAEEAIYAHTRARDLFQEVGNRHREAMAWSNLGVALEETSREGAIDALTRARDLFQEVGDRYREAMASANLGVALRKAGRGEETIEDCVRVLEIFQEFENWHRTAQLLQNLALVHQDANRPAEAHSCWLQAADAYTRAGDTAKAEELRAWAGRQY